MYNFRKIWFFIIAILFVMNISACGTSAAEGEVAASASQTAAALTAEEVPAETVTPQPTPTPDPIALATKKDGMEMVFVPAGDFIMGCEGVRCTIDVGPGPFPDDLVHTVYLDDYWIDKHPVTNGQYQECVADGACRPCFQNNIPPYGTDYFTEAEYADYPVVNVNWYMARDYCEWAGRRLPTEAEWEKAARGTDGRIYPWGDEKYTEEYANICDKDCPPGVRGNIANPNVDDGYKGPSPVGSYPKGASPYGALDMAGNVWEWTSTAAEFYPYDPDDGRESQYDIADGEKWPERILRGGPWNNGIWYIRSSYRYRAVANYHNMNMGFRCAFSE